MPLFFYLPFSDVDVQISKAPQRSGWWGCLLRSFGRPNVRMVWKGHLKDVWEMSIDEIQSIDIWWNKILKYGRWKKYVLLQRTQDSRFLILGVLQVWNDFDIKSWVVWNHRRSEWSWLPLRLLYALPGPDARWCTPHELSWKGKHPKKTLQFVTTA